VPRAVAFFFFFFLFRAGWLRLRAVPGSFSGKIAGLFSLPFLLFLFLANEGRRLAAKGRKAIVSLFPRFASQAFWTLAKVRRGFWRQSGPSPLFFFSAFFTDAFLEGWAAPRGLADGFLRGPLSFSPSPWPRVSSISAMFRSVIVSVFSLFSLFFFSVLHGNAAKRGSGPGVAGDRRRTPFLPSLFSSPARFSPLLPEAGIGLAHGERKGRSGPDAV